MNIKVFTKDSKQEILLRLTDNSLGGVDLRVVNSEGNRVTDGSLLTITNEGYVIFKRRITPDLGFPLGIYGKLMLKE